MSPADFLKPLEACLELWPEGRAAKPVGRRCILFTGTVSHRMRTAGWKAGKERKTGSGGIAFLYPEEAVSHYTSWHQAIVEEGAFKGDQYQFISLHENILFSYF